jgi:hypothetical protein
LADLLKIRVAAVIQSGVSDTIVDVAAGDQYRLELI